MEKAIYRIHGDNIVECERALKYLTNYVKPKNKKILFSSLSCLKVELQFSINNSDYYWIFEMFPSFNKNNRQRWNYDIFDALKNNGGILNETPDAFFTKLNGDKEELILAIEFCSALQAGNQAWQRSGRAYSTAQTTCPYLYIVDFVKYELDSKTRERKNLRFPNAAIPFSYLNYSDDSSFVAQAYVRSEEFSPETDDTIRNFDTSIFTDDMIGKYIFNKLINMPTEPIEKEFNDATLKMINFLAKNDNDNLKYSDYHDIYVNSKDIVQYSVEKNKFKFKKTIAASNKTKNIIKFLDLIKKYSVGLGSSDLPFGIIPYENKKNFVDEFAKIFNFEINKDDSILKTKKHLLICLLKGFKPGGDDNRPDRGALPFLSMLTKDKYEILTFIYGPIIESNYNLLMNNIKRLLDVSGFWRSILLLSDYVLVDSDVISNRRCIMHKSEYINTFSIGKVKRSIYDRKLIEFNCISDRPLSLHEDDVDTVIHSMFSYYLNVQCFEGLCNPPGGDWSGLSVLNNSIEYRWLSLPRVSVGESKRPDHVYQFNEVFDKNALLIIESKESPRDLEEFVGDGLKEYVKDLMEFIPSVVKKNNEWKICNESIDFNDYIFISAGAFIGNIALNYDEIHNYSECDMLFIFEPNQVTNKWRLKIISKTENSKKLEAYIMQNIKDDSNIEW